MEDKSHVIISVQAERTFGKIQQPFVIKILSKVGKKGMYFNVTKNIYENFTANILLSSEGLKLSLKD